MASQPRYRFSRYFAVGIVFVGILLLLTTCAYQSTTTFIKTPWPENQTKKSGDEIKALLTPSCLDLTQIKDLLYKDGAFKPIRTFYKNDGIKYLIDSIEKVIQAKRLGCDQKSGKWQDLKEQVLKDHEGFLVENEKELTREQIQTNLREAKTNFRKAIGMGKEVSVSISKPGSLALSTRAFPAEHEPGGVFAGLKERPQAAIIHFAEAFAEKYNKTQDKTGFAENDSKTPDKAVESLLKALSPPTKPRVVETQRVELTMSAIVNSGTIDDRFDYLTAYVSLPSLPGTVNGRISLERMWLGKFQARNFAHPEMKREGFILRDLYMALDSLQVKIETIDNLKTEAPTIQLGTLKSGTEFGLESGRTVGADFQITGVTAKVSAEREDKITKELDKRSAWIDKDRSMLRITQRGMQEATISGSISNLLTLKIPKTKLYLLDLDVKWKADKIEIEKVKSVKLKNVEQHLYGCVDAFGVVLGTVRVAIPSSYPFKREPDGIAYTVVEGPIHLKLWRHGRTLFSLDLQDLLPELKGKPVGIRPFGVYSTWPPVVQVAMFQDHEGVKSFIKAIKEKKLILEKHPNPKKNWYRIYPCGSSLHRDWREKPGKGEIWLGMENEHGLIQEFAGKEIVENLDEVAGKCPSK
jgi:hypothetical protein